MRTNRTSDEQKFPDFSKQINQSIFFEDLKKSNFLKNHLQLIISTIYP